ncbi:MAG: hypothetical protein KTR33_11750 [Gammaproteobacteria bacterium]|nr:hypothetical protein [Gammaproteobacteria bacterium]
MGRIVFMLLVFCCQCWTAQAVITNLVVNSEFENNTVTSPGVSDGEFFTDSTFDTAGQWGGFGNNLVTSNLVELWQEGFLSSPTTGSDGAATGQHLELRGQATNASVTLNIDIPLDVSPLSATLTFDSWFRVGDIADADGTIRIRRRFNNTGAWITEENSGFSNSSLTAWEANSYTFTVAAGDRVQVRFRNSPRTGDVQQGLHLDDVQLLVNIVPEPGIAGTILLAVSLVAAAFRRRFSAN